LPPSSGSGPAAKADTMAEWPTYEPPARWYIQTGEPEDWRNWPPATTTTNTTEESQQ